MNQFGRRLGAGLLAVTLLAVCGGCMRSQNIVFDSERGGMGGKEIQLDFFGYKYESLNVTAVETALHGFMDERPGVNIAYESLKSPAYFDILEKRMATGNGDDILMVDHARVQQLGAQGKLVDLSGLSTLDAFSDLAKSQMTAGGSIYYVPTSISAFGLYCNRTLLESCGQKVPANWAEFAAVCDEFTRRGIVPVVANSDISLKTVALAKGLYEIYRQDDPQEELERFNRGEDDFGEALRPGFELVETMLKRGYVDAAEALVTAKTQDDLTLFAAGTRPFLLTGAWAVPRLRDLHPNFTFSVHPYPILADGSVLVINIDTRVAVNADSAHVAEAEAFIEYFTRQDVLWKFVNSQCSFSPLKENRLAEDRAVQSIGPYLNNGRSVLGSDDNLRFPVWDMTKVCVREMLRGGTAAEAVTSLQRQLDDWREETA